MPQDYFHLSGAKLSTGSIIEPGNWGRIVNFYGWRHTEALKEMALEDARISRFSYRPSRLESVFVFLSEIDARGFRARIPAFNSHILYQVELVDPDALSHITDTRLSGPQGSLRSDWADLYWQKFDLATIAVPGIESWQSATLNLSQELEMITLSQLRIVRAMS